jgi:hypothetical protein
MLEFTYKGNRRRNSPQPNLLQGQVVEIRFGDIVTFRDFATVIAGDSPDRDLAAE